jgi:5'-nucleotidase
MRILITNDDGILAEGIAVLEAVAREIADEVWVIAPETDQSGKSHSLTLTEPLRLRQIDERHYAVKGTPTDCVIMALRHIMPEPPDLVLSGINRGSNVADDVTYSGTIAAAMEGTLLGVPSIALSQTYLKAVDIAPSWACGRAHAAEVIRKIIAAGIPKGTLINVNFPACEPEEVTGIEVTTQGAMGAGDVLVDHRIDARGFPYFWITFKGRGSDHAAPTDLWALGNRAISVTPVRLDLTDHGTRDSLKHAFR